MIAVDRIWQPEESQWRFDLLVGGAHAGLAEVIVLDHDVRLADLWIRPAYRGRGFARHLLADVLAAMGDRDMTLSAEPFEYPDQPPGPALTGGQLAAWYARHGFQPTGTGHMMHRPKETA